jgi:hypothetical protein
MGLANCNSSRRAVIAVTLLVCAFRASASAQENGTSALGNTPQIGSLPRPAPPRITQAIDQNNRVVLRGNVHPLAKPQFDQGAVSDALPMNRMLLLLRRSPAQEASLRQLLDQQQDKSSPNFHAWLTPEQFGWQFGPTDSDIQAITDWLASQGFQVNRVSAGRTVIEFSGNAGQVNNTFHTQIHRYNVNGAERIANAADPEIPAALAPVVAGVVSLNNFPRQSYAKYLGQFRHTAGKPGIQPLFTFPNPYSGGTFYGVAPGDFATIYNSKPLIASGNDGTGQTIAVVGETNINVQDVQAFRQLFGLPANFDASNVILNGEDPGITSKGEESEADLDVQWAGAVAPGATVKFVVSASTPTTAGIDLSALYIIEHNLAGVLSESYGACEQFLGASGNAFYKELWQQAAAQGITVVVSSGDGGSAGCDNFDTQTTATQGLAVSGLAATPFNVSVGGTDFDQINQWASFWSSANDPTTGTSALKYIPEIPWNENCAQLGLTGCGATAPQGSVNIVAGSGGRSAIYSKPSWQMGVSGMPNDGTRNQPDVSLFASPGFTGSGYIICQSDQTISGLPVCNLNSGVIDFGIVGGTSASAPAFAGIMALVNQKEASPQNPAPRQGNANYTLYALQKRSGASCVSSASEASTCIFNDVTKGNSFFPAGVGTNSVPCQGGTLNCSVSVSTQTGVLVDPGHTSTEAWTVTSGYDLATGLGSVNVNNLATNWANASTIGTTTTLSLSKTSGITHGSQENVGVNITVKQTSGSGVPSGDVSLIATFSDGSTRGIDEFTLTNGAISGVQTQNLPGGTYQVSAHYAGDGTNAPSDSAPVQVTVGTEGSQAFIVVPTFDSQGNPVSGNASSVTYGQPYIIRMYATNSSAVANPAGPPSPTCDLVNLLTCPTGTMTLTANGLPVDKGTFALNSAGYTRDIAPTLTGGTYSLLAQYSGDSSYAGSTSSGHTLTINPATTQMSLPLIPYSPALVGVAVPISAYLITNLQQGVAPTGSITFFDNGAQIPGPVTTVSRPGSPGLDASISGSVSATFTTSGTHSITAQYSGDASYAGSVSPAWSASVFWPANVGVTLSSTLVDYGQSVTVTATAVGSGKGPAMTGQFQFYGSYTAIPGTVTPTLSTDGNGNQILTATVTTTPLSSEVIQASYSGDANYQSSSATAFISVNIPDFSLVPAGQLNLTLGQAGSVQISVQPASTMTTPVTLGCYGPILAGYSCSLQPASLTLTNGIAGSTTLTLNPAPTSMIVQSAVKSKRSFAIPGVPLSRIPLSPSALLALLGGILLLAARNPAKRAYVSVGFALVCAGILIGCGGGNSSFAGGGGGNPTPQATTTTITTAGGKGAAGTPVTVAAKVTGANKPTGAVDFFANGGWVGTATLAADGTASTTINLVTPGIYTLTASYEGDGRNLASTSAGVSELMTGTTTVLVSGQLSTNNRIASVAVNVQ